MTDCERILATWREAERVLERLTPMSVDEDDVRLVILTMRELYQSIVRDRQPRLQAALAEATVERAEILLADIRARMGAVP